MLGKNGPENLGETSLVEQSRLNLQAQPKCDIETSISNPVHIGERRVLSPLLTFTALPTMEIIQKYYYTVNCPLADTLVSGQLYLRTPFQISVLPPSQTLYNTHSRKRTLSRKQMRTLLKIKIGFFFCLRSLVSGHPMYNNWLLAMKFVFNL